MASSFAPPAREVFASENHRCSSLPRCAIIPSQETKPSRDAPPFANSSHRNPRSANITAQRSKTSGDAPRGQGISGAHRFEGMREGRRGAGPHFAGITTQRTRSSCDAPWGQARGQAPLRNRTSSKINPNLCTLAGQAGGPRCAAKTTQRAKASSINGQ